MKSLAWFCLVAAAGSQVAYATDGIEAYRQGNYTLAAKKLSALPSKDPVANYYLGLMRLYGYGEVKNNDLALHYISDSADKGYLPAALLLGQYYLNKADDPEQAFQWFKKAAANDYIPAKMYVAAAYLFGYGVKKNEELAKRYIIDSAKSGNAIAQYTLGMQFLGSRDKSNKKLGLIWLTKSAMQDNPCAQLKLGEMYATGNQVAKSPEKAKELLEKSASVNYQPAMVSLGEMAKKQGDFQTAKTWFEKAANMDNHTAQFELAQLYLDSKAPFHDNKSGFLLMLKAAQNGSVEAAQSLSLLYRDGIGVEADKNLAAEWQQLALKTAAEHTKDAPYVAMAKWFSNDKASDLRKGDYQIGGIFNAWQNPEALKENTYNQPPQMEMLTRKVLYKPQFIMVKPNEIPINEYFDILAPMLSSNRSNDWSFLRYPLDKQIRVLEQLDSLVLKHEPSTSIVVKDATYGDDNEIKPFNYLEEKITGWRQQINYQAVLSALYQEAVLGDSSAQFELGQLYQYGIGVKKNVQQAVTYYQLAAAQQEVRAEYNLGTLYLEGKTDPLDYKKGMVWMTDAAFKGNSLAQYALANIYEQGLTDQTGNVVVKPDHPQAMAMYYLASSNNLGEAEYRLADLLVKEKKSGLSVVAKQNRSSLIKRLYQGAVNHGVTEASLPLAFYKSMDSSPVKQKEAFEVAKQEARAGNPEAALLLAIMYARGISVPADQIEAMYWYEKSGQNPVNAFVLGTYYCEGQGLSKSPEKCRELLQQSADAGFPYANLNLAILKHQTGEDFIAELNNARQAGNSKAGLLLADYYLEQANDPDKMKEAREIYQYFAEKGDRDAQTKLAFLYDRGLGGEANNELAAQWYGQAATQNQSVAQYQLGQLYQLGRIDKVPNYAEAKKWYELAKKSEAQAATALGFIYDTVDNNYANAAANYQLAATRGDAIGQFNLGLIYENGKGVPVDYLKAKDLYTAAANQGYAKAMNQLAGLYFKGLGGKRDEQQALYWYKKAAALGNTNALYELGLLSETGVATKLDFANAVSFYQQASNLGNEKAKLALARMYQYGLGVAKDYQHAADIYKDLAANNNAYAQYQLGVLYAEGTLGERQPSQAMLMLQQASKNGSKQARKMMQWLGAQQEPRVSFIEPVELTQEPPTLAEQPADLMYLNALNEWNRGDETLSRMILNKIMNKFPQYVPAKRAYEQLNNQTKTEQTLG